MNVYFVLNRTDHTYLAPMPPISPFSSILALRRGGQRLLPRFNPSYTPQAWQSSPRFLSSTRALSKKKDKSKPSPSNEPAEQPAAAKGPKTAPTSEDPDDLSAMQTGIQAATGRLKDELSKLRAGGRVNTETIETLKVQLKSAGGGGKDTARVGELAQVVPRGGRMTTVLVSEEDVSVSIILPADAGVLGVC